MDGEPTGSKTLHARSEIMNDTFFNLHRHVGRAAIVFLWAAAAFFALALAAALAGFPHAVGSFRSVSLACAIVFAATLVAFLAMSLVSVIIRGRRRREESTR
jgi:thiosulfate reductase cytochrome b subunit